MDHSEKKYSLEAYSVGDQIPPSMEVGWLSIFNAPQFFSLHAAGRRGGYFFYRDDASQAIVGRAHFTETSQGHFISPLRGTFGGFETEGTDMRLIEGFVEATERHLAALGARSIEVALKPFAYAPAFSACLFNVLARRGYTTHIYDLSYSMRVEPGELVEKMQRNNQKKVRKCQREGFLFARCESPEACRAAYDAVVVNRTSKGYVISMTYEQLGQMMALFPNRFHFFNVTQVGNVIAGAVCIAVSSDVLYVFYWGDLPGYEIFSPVVLLANGIYEFAQRNGFRLLDVGRSSLNNEPNYGLIRFKEKLGFEASLKLTFHKELKAVGHA